MTCTERAALWLVVLWTGFHAWPPMPVQVSFLEFLLPAVAYTCAKWSVRSFRIALAQRRSS